MMMTCLFNLPSSFRSMVPIVISIRRQRKANPQRARGCVSSIGDAQALGRWSTIGGNACTERRAWVGSELSKIGNAKEAGTALEFRSGYSLFVDFVQALAHLHEERI